MRHITLVLLLALAAPVAAQPVVLAPARAASPLDATQSSYLRAVADAAGSVSRVVVDERQLASAADARVYLDGARSVVLTTERVQAHEGGAYSWTGTEWDGVERVSQAVLTVKDGMVMGTISTPDGVYEVRPLGRGAHVLAKMPDGYVFETPEVEAWKARQPVAAPARVAAAASVRSPAAVTVRALFAYTTSARGLTPDIELVALQSLAYANQTYVNSDLDLEVEFAGTFETTLRESSSMSADLGAIRATNDGRGDEVHAERDRVGADLVILFRAADNTSTLGIAYTCAVSDDLAFGIFEVDGVGVAPVFTHEVGHNMGAAHQDNPTSCGGPDGRAYAPPSESWRTIMWSFLGSETIPYFSNPSVTYSGEATGIEGQANNARVVLNTASIIAGFRSTSGQLPGVLVNPEAPAVNAARNGVADVDLSLTNTGSAPLRWWTLSAYADEPDYYTLGEVLGDFGTTRSPLPATLGSCAGGTAATEGFATVALPFDFPFEGEVYRTARASVNGYVTFGGFDGCSSTPQPIGTAGGPDALIAALWSDDVARANQTMYTQRLADGRFAIKWLGGRVDAGAGRFFPANMLMILSEDGTIDIRYDSALRAAFGAGRIGDDAVVGYENADGSDGVAVPFGLTGRSGQIVFPNRAIQISQLQGEIAVGESGDVPLQIDASSLPIGVTTLTVTVVTNTPDRPVLSIPVEVTVTDVLSGEDGPGAVVTRLTVGPNPVRDHVTLGFSLGSPAPVRVALFDALGRVVRQLDLGPRPAGADELAFDTRGLAPGVYVVQLRAGETQVTRRLTVAR